MRYRVNFGNGQVHYVAGDSKKACFAFIASLINAGTESTGYARVQFQDPDTHEWFYTGNTEHERTLRGRI